VKNILKNQHKYYRLRNLLFNNSQSNSRLNFKPYTYLFIAGNIYYLNDFQKVCEFAAKENVKLIITSKKMLSQKLCTNYKSTIIQTGELSHNEILELTKNCIAGIAVFSKSNLNQKMAASSKIYEYAAFGKPIIVSRVPGVEIEVKEFSIKNVFYIDQLNTLKLINIPLTQSKFNDSFSFNNELLSLN
jgi:hypothetical protein